MPPEIHKLLFEKNINDRINLPQNGRIVSFLSTSFDRAIGLEIRGAQEYLHAHLYFLLF